jgi:hypothetical protein
LHHGSNFPALTRSWPALICNGAFNPATIPLRENERMWLRQVIRWWPEDDWDPPPTFSLREGPIDPADPLARVRSAVDPTLRPRRRGPSH